MPAATVTPLAPAPPFDGGPLAIAARWRSDRALVMLGSGLAHPRWSRWSILAEPAKWVVVDAGETEPVLALARALDETQLDAAPPRAAALPGFAGGATIDEIPFAGGWIGFLSYELGESVEPTARARPGRTRPDGHAWPLAAFAWCPSALVHDSARRLWWSVVRDGASSPAGCLDPAGSRRRARPPAADGWSLGPFVETVDRGAWMGMVERAAEYIRAGDIFQANLAQLLRSSLRGGVRPMALSALDAVQPWHGALLELPDGSAIVSLSPELFLQGALARGGRDPFLVARPIKGTRPDGDDPASLLRSEKDAAELHMIVDLMRNDLGRVCEIGSVCVSEQRHVERHPTVHQAVATVEGVPRGDVDVAALLRATFPPGSITGAPKVRAMQVIAELEAAPRGPYCGAVGFIGDDGQLALNVAIRTITAAPPGDGEHAVTYGVGCGIVADSDPAAEWEESMAKARVARLVRERSPHG